MIGVVGVGVNVDYIKGLLQEYEKEYDVATYLINEKGEIEVSSLYNGHQTADWFKVNDSEDIRSEILEWKTAGPTGISGCRAMCRITKKLSGRPLYPRSVVVSAGKAGYRRLTGRAE